MEDTIVDDKGGQIALKQAFLKFNLNLTKFITAGLFLRRIGLLNENHLLVNFNGVERPGVEQLDNTFYLAGTGRGLLWPLKKITPYFF